MNLIETSNTVYLIKSLFNDQNYSKLVTYIMFFMHLSNHETTKINPSDIVKTVCLIQSLFNDQMYTESTQLIG